MISSPGVRGAERDTIAERLDASDLIALLTARWTATYAMRWSHGPRVYRLVWCGADREKVIRVGRAVMAA